MPIRTCYQKRGELAVKNLKKHNFDAYYCDTKEEARKIALSLIPEGASVGWGGAMSAEQIGLIDAVRSGNYNAYDRDTCQTVEQRDQLMHACLSADVFLSGANAISIDGQMVNIDGNGNRVSAIIYGPASVIVIAGMNKVVDTVEDAIQRARTIAAPMNHQRFPGNAPCTVTGKCGDCFCEDCICNHIVITRHSRIPGRIKFVLVGEELGM